MKNKNIPLEVQCLHNLVQTLTSMPLNRSHFSTKKYPNQNNINAKT